MATRAWTKPPGRSAVAADRSKRIPTRDLLTAAASRTLTRLVIGTLNAHVERVRFQKLLDFRKELIGSPGFFQEELPLHPAVGNLCLSRLEDRHRTDPHANARQQHKEANSDL